MIKDDSPEAVIDRLLDADVVETADSNKYTEQKLRLTDEFTGLVQQCETMVSHLDESELQQKLSSEINDKQEVSELLSMADTDEKILAEYLAICRTELDNLPHEDRLRALAAFSTFRRPTPPNNGTPDPFVPVNGERLPFLVRLYPRAVVYIWLEDCRPCELMKETFESTIPEPSDTIALLSVYGPDCSKLLQERYNVVGGPATLFFVDGQVDARFYGAQYEQVVETEVQKLQNLP